MVLEDRLTQGFLAGLVAGVAMNAVNLASFYADVGELRYLDWAGAIIYGARPHTFWEAIFAQTAQILFVGILGIVFVYLIPRIKSSNLYFKGWLFGAAMWFAFYGLTLLFKHKGTIPIDVQTAASDLAGASVYGLALAWALRWMDERRRVR